MVEGVLAELLVDGELEVLGFDDESDVLGFDDESDVLGFDDESDVLGFDESEVIPEVSPLLLTVTSSALLATPKTVIPKIKAVPAINFSFFKCLTFSFCNMP